MHIKILFNIGKYNECINIGYNIINVLDSRKINSLNLLYAEEFTDLLLETIICIALSGIILLRDDIEEFLKLFIALSITENKYSFEEDE